MARVQQAMYLPHRFQRTALRPVSVLLRRQVGLKDRPQDQHRRRLRYTIPDRRNAQGSELTVRFWDIYSPDRLRLVRFVSEFQRQFPKPSLHAICFDVLEPYSIHTGGPCIGFAASIGMGQYIISVQLVIQRIEAITRFTLRFGMQRLLQLLNLYRS